MPIDATSIFQEGVRIPPVKLWKQGVQNEDLLKLVMHQVRTPDWCKAVRAIIASSFSDIFSSNAFKNGILAATVDEAAIAPLVEAARDGDLKVDLLQQTVSAGASLEFDFTIDSFRRRCLIEGLNEIELSLLDAEFIIKHEQRVAGQTPWLARAGTA